MKGQEEAEGKHSWKKNKLVQRLGGILGGKQSPLRQECLRIKRKRKEMRLTRSRGSDFAWSVKPSKEVLDFILKFLEAIKEKLKRKKYQSLTNACFIHRNKKVIEPWPMSSLTPGSCPSKTRSGLLLSERERERKKKTLTGWSS